MNTVILVGAGATLAEALPRNPPKTKLPPLDYTFFRQCSYNKYSELQIVTDYMYNHYRIKPTSDNSGMEEIFNYIYSDLHSNRNLPEVRNVYFALVNMYRKIIAVSTNDLIGNGRKGIGELLRFLYRLNQNRNINIITFNQDLLIEKSLELISSQRSYNFVPWNIKLTYPNNIENFTTRKRNPSSFKNTGTNSVEIYKLHGSLNWLYPVKNSDDPKKHLRIPKGELICLNDSIIMQRTFKFKRKRIRTHTNPLIVPPIYNKEDIIGKVLTPLWDGAREKIELADELIVFGYSFPQTDYSSRSLFKGSFIANNRLKGVHVIDISPNTIKNIAELLNTDFTFHYNTVVEFKTKYQS